MMLRMLEGEKSGYSPVTIGLFIACVLMSGAVAFTVGTKNPTSQLAVGTMADQMCASSRADARCECNKGIDPRTGQCSRSISGGGKIGCPCRDITAGEVAASGKCAAVGRCFADQAGGMMPMLPMLPMMMPMPKMPAPPEQPCMPTAASSSPSVGGLASVAPWGAAPCPADRGLLHESLNVGDDTNTTATTSEDDETSTSTHATSSAAIRRSLVRFLQSVGIFQDTGTTTVEVDMGPGFVPLRIVFGRGDAIEMRPGGITILYEYSSTSGETLGPRVRRFGQSTFMYEEPLHQSVAVFSRTLSTLERMLSRMLAWIQG